MPSLLTPFLCFFILLFFSYKAWSLSVPITFGCVYLLMNIEAVFLSII